jgi:signal transduction histidine kinase
VRLRTRIAVVTIAVTVPMVVLLMWLDGRARHRAAAYVLAEGAAHRLAAPGARQRCEASPATWSRPGPDHPFGRRHLDDGGPPPPPRLPPHPPRPPRPPPMAIPRGAPPVHHAYDEQRVAASPSAPTLSADDVRGLAPGEASTLDRAWYEEDVEVVTRTPWGTGPCAYVVTHGTTTPGFIGALLPASPIWLLPLAAVLIAVLLAVGPVVARIRRLRAAVERSATNDFAVELPPDATDGSDELADLARAFDAAAREVRAQLTARDEREQTLRAFLSNTTHDVMIPLTVLQAHLTTLRETHAAGRAPDPIILTAAMDEAHYIGALLHNLAVAAKLDAGAPGLLRGPVDLNALVSRVVSRHAPIARQREIALEHAVPEQPLATDADVTMLEQAVSNVLYNAIRHNRTGGHVALILEPDRDERFRIRVIDDGPGIPAAELARMAQRGERGDAARTRHPDGQGLGLDIAHRVARLHGHELRFTTSEYGGLQVDLEGPIARPDEPAADQELSEDPDSSCHG